MRVFLDTSVLVYADDLDAGPRRTIARERLRTAMASGSAAVSTQVLQEYFVVATRKLGVDPQVAGTKVELLATMDVFTIDVDAVLAAIDMHRLASISFWDALIVASAAAAGCEQLCTENLQHGQVIQGVRVENPFRDA